MMGCGGQEPGFKYLERKKEAWAIEPLNLLLYS